MNTQNIELDVLVNGRPVKQHGHQGRTYIEANPGSEYSIKIRNNNGFRVMAVVSVDGIDVVSGKPASFDSSGYIIRAYSALDIKGYRKDLAEVGAFKFVKKSSKTYAKQVTGSVENRGVIAVAIFQEKIPTYCGGAIYINNSSPVFGSNIPATTDYHYDFSTQGSYSPSTSNNSGASMKLCASNVSSTVTDWDSAKTKTLCNGGSIIRSRSLSRAGGQNCSVSEAPKFEVGSGWGKKIENRVVYVDFEKQSSSPMAVLNLYYDSRESLENAGLDLGKEQKVSIPNGFPNQFATPPANWNG